MKRTVHENHIARAARFLAAELESKNEVCLIITGNYADSRIFRIIQYLTHYCGKYWITYPGNGTAIIRKQE